MKDDSRHQRSLAELDKILAGKIAVATNDRIELRDAVCAYLSAERAKGTSIKKISKALMVVLRKAEGALGTTDELLQQLLDWCLRFHILAPAPS